VIPATLHRILLKDEFLELLKDTVVELTVKNRRAVSLEKYSVVTFKVAGRDLFATPELPPQL
jgi:hypothetical protein